MSVCWPDLEKIEQDLVATAVRKGYRLAWQAIADPAAGPGAFILEVGTQGGKTREQWSFPGIPVQVPSLLMLEAKRFDGMHWRHPLWHTLILDGVVAVADAPEIFGTILLEPSSQTNPWGEILGPLAEKDPAAGRKFVADVLERMGPDGTRRGSWSRTETDTMALAAILAKCWPDRYLGFLHSLHAAEALLAGIMETRPDILNRRLSDGPLPTYFTSPWRGMAPRNRNLIIADIVWPACGQMINLMDTLMTEKWASGISCGAYSREILPGKILKYARLMEQYLFQRPPADVKKFLARLKSRWLGKGMDEIWVHYLGQTLEERHRQTCAKGAIHAFDREWENGPCL
jgi:hypothetical protein